MPFIKIRGKKRKVIRTNNHSITSTREVATKAKKIIGDLNKRYFGLTQTIFGLPDLFEAFIYAYPNIEDEIEESIRELHEKHDSIAEK